MTPSNLKRLLTGATAITGLTISLGAHAVAQVAPPANGQGVAPAVSPEGLTEVIVTSQRRAERLQDVPISVTAVNSADLAKNGINDVSRLEMITPGFTFGQSGSDARPAIRGVRTETISAPNDPSIGFYLDGVYQSRAQQALIPLLDIDRVEVQRGPQGTLYGRNTFGGNISVVTQAPINKAAAGAEVEFGDYSLFKLNGFINMPVSDLVQIRVAAERLTQDGYVKSTQNPAININQKDENIVRAEVRLLPLDSVEVLLRAGYWQNTGDGGGAYGYKVLGTLINPTTGLRSVYGAPVYVNPTVTTAANPEGIPVTRDPYKNDWDYEPFENTHEEYGTAQINWNLGDFAVLRSITGYTQFRSDRSADLDQSGVVFPAPFVKSGFAASGYQENDTNVESTSEELQLASKESKPLQWVFGAYDLHDRIREPYTQVYTAPTALAVDTRSITQLNTNAYAAYAQGSYFVLPDKLRLTAGLRYTSETKDYDIANFNIPEAGGLISGAPVRTSGSSGGPTFNKLIYRADADYFLAKDNMLYANVSTGFRSGGLNNNSTNALIPASFGPEEVRAYEIGSKNRFFQNKLQVDAAAFYYDFSNLQISVLDPATNLSYTRNAGAATSKGGEVSFEALPFGGLRLNGSITYLDAVYTNYLRPNDFYTATNGDPHTISLAGNEIPNSPKWRTTLGVAYDFDFGNVGVITPYAAWLYSSHYFGTDYNTLLDKQDAYGKVDLSLSWVSADGHYTLELYGHNLTDIAVLNRAVLGNNQRIQGSYEPPRMFGVKLGARY